MYDYIDESMVSIDRVTHLSTPDAMLSENQSETIYNSAVAHCSGLTDQSNVVKMTGSGSGGSGPGLSVDGHEGLAPTSGPNEDEDDNDDEQETISLPFANLFARLKPGRASSGAGLGSGGQPTKARKTQQPKKHQVQVTATGSASEKTKARVLMVDQHHHHQYHRRRVMTRH